MPEPVDLGSLYVAQNDGESIRASTAELRSINSASLPVASMTPQEEYQRRIQQLCYLMTSPSDNPSWFKVSLDRSTKKQRMQRLRDRRPYFVVKSLPALDYDLVKKWMGACSNHYPCRLQFGRPVTFNMLMVDCIEMKITVIDMNTINIADVMYFALSYVWGGVPAFELRCSNLSQLCSPGSLNGLQNEVSRTVWDAIQFVKRIGARYLWVDRLCIVQDHEESKQNGIQHMDVIYESAWAVIIAGSGTDTSAGLPGVHQRFSADESFQSSASNQINDDSLMDTIYETRAWTYQERLLARRRFIFLQNFLLFQCREATYRDDICFANSQKLYDIRDVYVGEGGLVLEHFADPYEAFRNVVQTYTTRHIRFENDILNALAGISNVLGRRLGTRLVYGLPESMLIDSLSWHIKEPLEGTPSRRNGFPSWSWSGWRGSISIPPKNSKGFYEYGSINTNVSPMNYGDNRLKLKTILFRMSVGTVCDDGASSSSTLCHWICVPGPDSIICGQIQLHCDPTVHNVPNEFTGKEAYFIVLEDAAQPSLPDSDGEIIRAQSFNNEIGIDELENSNDLNSKEKRLYRERPFLIVLMVVQRISGTGAVEWERIGVGHIYRRAILLSKEFSFEEEFVLC